MRLRNGFCGERYIVLPRVVVKMMEEDPTASALFITDMGYYPKASHHYCLRTEPIDQFVLIYCVDGEGWYELDGRRFDVSPNRFFILPPGKPHLYAASEESPWTIYWVHFRGRMAGHYAANKTEPQAVSPGVASRIKDRNELFEEIFSTLNVSLTLESLRYSMGAFHHYLSSLVYIRGYRRTDTGKFDAPVVQSVIHYLAENIEKHLSLQDIADFSGFSPSHLSAMFKEETGHSPISYFNILKVRHACGLLKDTDMTLVQISFKLGISDSFYFSRLFSKIMGMSPKAYRVSPRP